MITGIRRESPDGGSGSLCQHCGGLPVSSAPASPLGPRTLPCADDDSRITRGWTMRTKMGHACTRQQSSGHFYDVICEPLNAPELKISLTTCPRASNAPSERHSLDGRALCALRGLFRVQPPGRVNPLPGPPRGLRLLSEFPAFTGW